MPAAAPRKMKARPSSVFLKHEEPSSSLDLYLDEVSREDLLRPDEERALALRARSGDEQAMQELVRRNLRFVVSVAKKYQGRGLSLADLIQEGNRGLVRAAMDFDPEQGVKFISYAVWWVRQSILLALANGGRVVRLPTNRASDLSRLQREATALLEALGREATASELAERTGMSVDDVSVLLNVARSEIRLDASRPGSEGEEPLLDRFLGPEADGGEVGAEVEGRLREEYVRQALDILPEREALVLRLYYGVGTDMEMTLEQIGQRIGVTRERVRQIRNRAIERLRNGEAAETLASLA